MFPAARLYNWGRESHLAALFVVGGGVFAHQRGCGVNMALADRFFDEVYSSSIRVRNLGGFHQYDCTAVLGDARTELTQRDGGATKNRQE